MTRKSGDNPDRSRRLLAQEAARIIVDQGLRDYRSAKIKAADALGMSNYGSLPGNKEIEQAISDHLQLFGGESHTSFLAAVRAAAMSAMILLVDFEPRLVGAVLTGTADPNSAVDLHVFSDTTELIALRLSSLDLSYKSYERRLKIRHNQVDAFPGFAFIYDGTEIECTVFPIDGIRQAPISPIDRKPIQRADIKAVQKLIKQP